jgi:hypothetical protein
VLTVGVVIGPTVTGGTVTEGTVTEGTVTVGTDTAGTDTVGSGGRAEETDGSVSRDARAVLWAAELPIATAVDKAAPARRAAHATRAVSRRRVIVWLLRAPGRSREVAGACHPSPNDL